MASQKSLVIRRTDAMERIKEALGKLQAAVGLGDTVELDPQHRDPEIKQTLMIENLAAALESASLAVQATEEARINLPKGKGGKSDK